MWKSFWKILNNLGCETDQVGFRFRCICFVCSASSKTFVLIWSRLSFFHSFSFLALCYLCVPLFFLRQVFGTSKWEGRPDEKKTSHEQLNSATRSFLPRESQLSRLNVWPPFSSESNFGACVSIFVVHVSNSRSFLIFGFPLAQDFDVKMRMLTFSQSKN